MKKTIVLLLSVLTFVCQSHDQVEHRNDTVNQEGGQVTYLGNTGLLVEQGEVQLLFDPFFHNHYGQYQLVPDEIRQSMFSAEAPYDSVELILISHAHGDHFDAKDVVAFLSKNPETQLLAPQQAVDQLKAITGYESVVNQIKGIDLAYGDAPETVQYKDIVVDVVRIPHAGWPARADVANLVYRVTLNRTATVMHMGDADPDDEHFKPWAEYWQSQQTDRAYPPYWFMLTPAGQDILANRINAAHATGVHVPVVVPAALQQSGAEYFSTTGSSHAIHSNPKTNKQ